MTTIYVVHIMKHNLRHAPKHTHSVGNLQRVRDDLLGLACKEQFDCLYALLAYVAGVNKDTDYQLVHSYECEDAK